MHRAFIVGIAALAMVGTANADLGFAWADITGAEWNVTDFQEGTTAITATAWNIEGTYGIESPEPNELVDVCVSFDLTVDLAGPNQPPMLMEIAVQDFYLGTWDGFDDSDFVPVFADTIPLPDIVIDPNTVLTGLMLDAFVDFDNGSNLTGSFGAAATANATLYEAGVESSNGSLAYIANMLRSGDPDQDNSISGTGTGTIRFDFVPEPASLMLLTLALPLIRRR